MFYKQLGIICGILHLDYLKMRVKKVNIFQDIALKNFISIESIFFNLQKFNISFMLYRYPILKKIVLSWRIEHFTKIIFEGRVFRAGSDEKMRSMRLGLEIAVAGLPLPVEYGHEYYYVFCSFIF